MDVDPDFLGVTDTEDHHDENHGHSHGHHCSGDGCSHSDHKDGDKPVIKTTSHQHDHTVGSIGFKLRDDLSLGLLQQFIQTLLVDMGKDLYRYKGVISVKGMPKRFVFQGVHMLFGGDFTEKWEESEVRESKFVFIGKNLDKKRLEEGFLNCKAGELRFNVGDAVFARTGVGYQKGKIVSQWEEGNAYRILLEDDEGTEVYGPIDDDMYVRSVVNMPSNKE